MDTIYNSIRNALYKNMKERNKKNTDVLRFVMAEIQRNPMKDYSDATVLAVIKRIISQFKENTYVDTTAEIAYLESSFLPIQVTDEQIIDAIKQVDFSKITNKFAAIKDIIKRFPAGSIDGGRVRELIIQVMGK